MTILNSGKVGIGSVNPAYDMHIYNSGNASLKVGAGGNGNAYIRFGESGSGSADYGGLFKYDGTNDRVELGSIVNTTEYPVIYMQRGGLNAGIGTSSPTAFKLQVAGNVGPSSTNSYDLGSVAYAWRTAYVSSSIIGGKSQLQTNKIEFGYNSNASGGYGSIAVGYNVSATGTASVSLGQSTAAGGYDAVALGYGNKAYGDYSTALGKSITVTGNTSFGIGLDSTARTVSQANTMAILGGNVGIGEASPNALLTVGNGDLFQVNSSGYVRGVDGSAAAPSYSFVSDTDTGIYRSWDNALGISTGGTERIAIYSAATVFRRQSGSAGGNISLETADGNYGIHLVAPATSDVDDEVFFTLPTNYGGNGQVLSTDATGNLYWTSSITSGTLQPASTTQLKIADSSYTATDVNIDSNLAVISYNDAGPNGFIDYYKNNNGSLTLASQYFLPGIRSSRTIGNYTYGNTGQKLFIANMVDVENPALSGSVDYDLTSNDSWLDVAGHYAYVGGSSDGKLYVIDVSDATRPFLAKTLTASGISGITAYGQYLLVKQTGVGATIYDLATDPVNLVSLGTGCNTNVAAAAIDGRTLYCVDTTGSLTAQDIAGFGGMVQFASKAIGRAVGASAKMIVNRNLVYVLENSTYLSIWRLNGSTFDLVYEAANATAFGSGQAMGMTGNTLVTFAGSTDISLTAWDLNGTKIDSLNAGSTEISKLTVVNNTDLNGGLTVGGTGLFSGNLQVNGKIGISGAAHFNNEVDISGSLFIKKTSTASTESWSTLQTIDAPSARDYHTAVWTGEDMIVWGGRTGAGSYVDTGAKYNPLSNQWTALTTTNAPTGRAFHSAVWTGDKMIVWGGANNTGALSTGSIYNPKTDTWSTISNTGVSGANRYLHHGIWTGSKMLIWGGMNIAGAGTTTGFIYDPVADSWTSMAAGAGQAPCIYTAAVWTGNKLLVWGGWNTTLGNYCNGYSWTQSGGWSLMSTTNQPSGRYMPTGVWTGNKFIVWGGYNAGNIPVNTGGIYDPDTDTWSSLTTTGAPTARYGHTAVWDGNQMLIWSGTSTLAITNTGGAYNPVGNSWSSFTTTGAPTGRLVPRTVWTGSQMITWGGINASGWNATGGVYNPVNFYQGNLSVEGNGFFGGRVGIVGSAHAGGFYSVSGADFAEYLPHENAGLSAGDVVALSGSSTGYIVRSSADKRDKMVGVITDSPAMVGNAKESYQNDPDHYALVSMLGQVNVKFSPANGPVAPGDWLMAGDDGYAIKAKGSGIVLGRALQVGNATSSVLTYVKPIYWAGDLLAADGSVNLVKGDIALTAKGTADAAHRGFDSQAFTLQGSGWDSAASSSVVTNFSLFNRTISATSSELIISFTTGTNSISDFSFKLNQNGDASVRGDLTVGKRLYLGSKVNGQGSTTTYIYVDDTLAPTSTYIATNADGWQTLSTYDYAERYESSDDLVPGDLVTTDPAGVNKVKRVVSTAEPIIGIVSTKPGFVTGAYAKGNFPIALAGRVPTRVSTANGTIAIGDYLAASDMPGVAVRATGTGNVVGIALEPYTLPEVGLISVFVKPSYMAATIGTAGLP
ncbi:MAG: hypothetical protein PHW33_04190, partial [Candidatus Portnoybacteria bacterium]|nr:hypothetical protein [Candidatus Portnoybacteria bacterium]